MKHSVLMAALLMAMAGYSQIAIDCAYPGGNVEVLGIDEAKGEVRVSPDYGESTDWFWFNFRVKGAEGRRIRFVFPRQENVLGALGPCVSADDGRSWRFLNEQGHPETNVFIYEFAADAKAVRFAHGMPYVEAQWREFTDRFRGNPRAKFGSLCKSRLGKRDVDLLTIEPDADANPEWTFFFTARHHCSEVSASPVVEGLVAAAFADDETGRWIRRHARVYVVPFMDKDGVENGDQGKNRRPWDYNRDYLKERYPEVRAFKKLMVEKSVGTKIFFIDNHSPWIRGNEHEWYFSLGPIDKPQQDRHWRAYRKALAVATKGGPLEYQPKWDIPGGIGYNVPKNLGGTDYPSSTRWCVDVPNMYCGFCMEYGYARCGGVFSREKAQTLGRQVVKAIVDSILAER